MFSKIIAFFMSMIMMLTSELSWFLRYFKVGDIIDDKTAEITEYVNKNLPVLGEALAILGEGFYASGIEKTIPCTVIYEDGEKLSGAYIDFSGNFGYMVITLDHIVEAYKCEGDFPTLRKYESLVYSITEGFGEDVSGEFIPFGIEGLRADESLFLDYPESFFNYLSEDGCITDSDEYVLGQYGEGFELKNEFMLPDFEYSTQMSTSVYRYIPKPGWWTSEGNCSLNAIYAMFNYIKSKAGDTTDKVFSALPSSGEKAIIYADRDPFFDKFKNDENYDIMGYNRKTGKCVGFTVPMLYKDIRDFVVKSYGYETTGTDTDNFKHIVNSFLKKYGIDGYKLMKHEDLKEFTLAIIPYLKTGYPVLWSVSDSSSYGSHTTVITGYRIYDKTTIVKGIKIVTDRVIMFKLNDNWSEDGGYFDYTRYNILSGGFYTVEK